jgi:hypothetical protein
MVGMFVCLCLASQKPSEREYFVPARTDLGVKLLRFLGIHLTIHGTLIREYRSVSLIKC